MTGKLFFLSLVLAGCSGATGEKAPVENRQIVGGGCDGCELMYIGMPEKIGAVDTSAGWKEEGQKLVISGTVFHPDGKTPAPDVVIYYWQTDNSGHYTPSPGMDERVTRHGHIRGWVQTGVDGRYTICTIRPAPYPDDSLPAHIHLSIKEPDIANEYYTDELNFDDDPLLTPHFKKYPQERRGGSGVVHISTQNSIQLAEHNIILGLNIPGYRRR